MENAHFKNRTVFIVKEFSVVPFRTTEAIVYSLKYISQKTQAVAINSSNNKDRIIMSSAIHTKIYFAPGQQVRRMKIDTNVPYDEFKQQLTKLHETSPMFKIGEYVYQLMYQDEEEDWVLVDSEDEWRTALNTHKDSDLFRIKFIAVNKSLQTINNCRKECQQVVADRFNKNVKPLIHQLKEYVKDPEKQQEAKEWVKDLTNKIGTQAQTGYNDVHNRVETWLKNNEVPQKVEQYVKDIETMANTIADRVEEVITNKLYPEVEDEEEIDEPVEEETNLEDDDEYQLIDDVIPVEPQQVETIQIVEEVKEPEFQVPSEFTEHFKSLEEMGFKDKELNLRLLKVHKGDLVKVVSALLSLPL
jgi:polyhydroxyalkanoate synthesis regulator phasin